MKIALCVKQVPDTTNIRWTENNTMQREGVESVINPYDIYAAELALSIAEKLKDAEITAFTMGPNQAQDMLRKLISIGVDNGVLISDRKFAGADTYATGKTIAAAIKKVLPDFDLIICGQFAVDGDTAQTGPSIAGNLGVPQVTYVKSFEKADNKSIVLKRELDDGIETVKVKYPALICVLQDTFEPRRPMINGIKLASKVDIPVLTLEDLGLSDAQVGLKGSPTYVSRAYRNQSKHNSQKYELSVGESVDLLRDKVKEYGCGECVMGASVAQEEGKDA
ncbi:electron transfer flavoprotein subunit beta/FixA family protein [bacterium]|nr:electron transfer flavoprotein subunit beta/FixA family protein [bacterium]